MILRPCFFIASAQVIKVDIFRNSMVFMVRICLDPSNFVTENDVFQIEPLNVHSMDMAKTLRS
jgi:hypothetical protein